MTPEEIAREAAEALVSVYSRAGTPYDKGEQGFSVCGVEVACRRMSEAEGYARGVKDALAKAFLAAVERALREVPVGSPVSDDRLAEIRRDWAKHKTVRTEYVGDLLVHADHLTRLLQDAAADGVLTRTQEVRDAAFRAGAAAQRRAMVDAAQDRCDSYPILSEGARAVANAVADVPLAEPPV